jgi:pectate lyase
VFSLKVTLHHNLFENVGQRTPRVRFGQVHVYDNYYRNEGFTGYVYSWGVGVESQIYAENNFFRTSEEIAPDRYIARFGGTAIVTLQTNVNASSANHVVDVRAAYNGANDPDLDDEVGWTPTLYGGLDPSHRVPGRVESGAGPFNW